MDIHMKTEGEAIIRGMAAQYECTVADIVGRCRKQWICKIRAKAMIKLYDEGFSYTQIGEIVGGRDRQTVGHYVELHGPTRKVYKYSSSHKKMRAGNSRMDLRGMLTGG